MRQLNVLILALIIGLIGVVNAQNSVTVSFTGQGNGGVNQSLTKVVVKNLTRNWSETIYAPDLSLTLTVGTGIEDYQNTSFGLSQNVPNPFSEYSSVKLAMPETGDVILQLIDMNGKVLTQSTNQLSAGIHDFEVRINAPNTYILTASTGAYKSSIKLNKIGKGGENSIIYKQNSILKTFKLVNQTATKGGTSKLFQLGDQMQYIGYGVYSGKSYASTPVTRYQYNTETINLQFIYNVVALEEGIYLGIIGFNQDLYTKEITLLNVSSQSGFNTFVNSLTTKNGTVIYKAVEQGISNLNKATIPPELDNVSIVTFSDGLDQGSRFFEDPPIYSTGNEYLAALNYSIHNTKIGGLNIDAHAIGLKGTDIVDMTSFENSIDSLASADTNALTVADMNVVKNKFKEIAARLYSQSVNQSISLKIPGQNEGARIRFTFDNVSNAANSTMYIEGTFSGSSLINVVYTGLNSTSGTSVTGSKTGIFFTYLFKNVSTVLGDQVSLDNVKQWAYIPSSTNWQINSEFTEAGNTEVVENKKSALIMLVLDCSSSLGTTDFALMKESAIEFIAALLGGGTTSKPTVTSGSYSSLTSTSAACTGNVTNDGGLTVTERGIYYSVNSNMSGGLYKSSGSGTGSFTATLSGLTSNTTYYYKAYAKNSAGTSFGDLKQFTTNPPAGCPTVTTNAATNIAATTVTLNGNVTADGGASVTSRGFYYGTSSMSLTNSVTSGSGTGSFTKALTGLTAETTYYYMAFATNTAGTSYGNVLSFTTSSTFTNQTITANGVSFTMIAVQGGTFSMGNADYASPVHSVTLSNYYIGQTEVTQALWQAVMGSNPSYFTGNLQRPVEQVSWNDVQSFITALNSLTGKTFRMPTEAEWEYAARGGNQSNGYTYSGSNTIGNVAWYTDNSSSTTHAVKTKAANELGIYDMSGNVWEWCYDWYGSYSSGSQTNPTGAASGSNRVYRGGSWGSDAAGCRVASRGSNTPGNRNNGIGVRLVLVQ